MAKFLFLWSTSDLPDPIRQPPPGHEIAPLDQYEFDGLAGPALASFDGLIVSSHADQGHLQTHRERLDAFLEMRSILVNGPTVVPFLPELSQHFEPLPRRGVGDLQVAMTHQHPVVAGVEASDLTFRHGVAGFWGRGYQPPPAGAEVLTTLGPDCVVLDWCLERAGGGRLFVHPGNDVWTLAGHTSAGRLWPQLLDWLGRGR